MAPIVVALVVVAVAVGITISHRGNDATPAASTATVTAATDGGVPASSAPPTISAAPAAPATPATSTTSTGVATFTGATERPRALIPWAQVGPGWTAAIWSATWSDDPTKPPAPATLFLVAPTGTRYPVGQVDTTTSMGDLSPDGRRVLVYTGSTVTEWDVASGAVAHRFSLPGTGIDHLGYTNPSAEAVLVARHDTATYAPLPLERHGLDGTLQQAYPGLTGVPLESSDGLTLASGLEVFDNAGHLVRSLTPPSGYEGCRSLRWWQPGQLLEACDLPKGDLMNLWVLPVSGAPATALTRASGDANTERSTQFGFVDAWHTDVGTLVRYGSGCGLGALGLLAPDGLADPFHVVNPAPPGSDSGPDISAVVGRTAWFSVSGCAGPASVSLDITELGTTSMHTLLGPGANSGTVVGAVTLGPTL